ncbi:MAG: S8 family peptidase [Solirubrobacterales bacterium]
MLGLGLVVFSSVGSAPGPAQASAGAAERDGMVIGFSETADGDDRRRARQAVGGRLSGQVDLPADAAPTQVVDMASGGPDRNALRSVERMPGVEFAEPVATVTASALRIDPLFSRQWGLHNTATSGADIGALGAWTVTRGEGAPPIAVVDGGIDLDHPDLANKIWTNPGETGSGRETNGLDDDGNGLVDDWRGWDWYEGDRDPDDPSGHGTHVAGIAAAQAGDGFGVAGVSWGSPVMALRFIGPDGTGSSVGAAEAITYAARHGARVINASFGSPQRSQLIERAIEAATNSVVVVAAGNDGVDVDHDARYPCALPADNVVCVAASTSADDRWASSNIGGASVDLAAPGESILSTLPGGGHGSYTGTSMATPFVAGAAALLLAKTPSLAPGSVRQVLTSTVDAVPAFAGVTASGGRLNLARALGTSKDARSVPPVPPKPSPTAPSPRSQPDTGAPVASVQVSRRLRLATLARRGVLVRCRAAGGATCKATVTVGAHSAKRLGIRARSRRSANIGSRRLALRSARTRTIQVRPAYAVRRALTRTRRDPKARRRARGARLVVRITVRGANGRTSRVRRVVTVR